MRHAEVFQGKPRQRGFGFEATPGSDDWWTPRWIFEALNLRFDLDPCAGTDDMSALGMACRIPARDWCIGSYVKEGLDREWDGRVWLNPPYSDMDAWVSRFLGHVLHGGTGVTLTYCRMERPWAQALLMAVKNHPARRVLFLGTNPLDGRARVHFIPGPKNPARERKSAPGGPSMLCGFGREESDALLRMESEGHGVCL